MRSDSTNPNNKDLTTLPIPPIVGEEVLHDFRCKRLSEDDRLKWTDKVVDSARDLGAKGLFLREILKVCEEPLLNVQSYQNVRFELKDLKIHFHVSFTNGDQFYVSLSNYVHPDDAESLAFYLRRVQNMDVEEARARVREVLPKAEIDSSDGSGIGLILLRGRTFSFEYSLVPEGQFVNYTLRISLVYKDKLV
ncbi:MAG: DUF6272 family protein [Bacteroides sp.]